MARTDTLPNFLTDVADAIREKKGTEETIQASDFDTEIANLPSGGDVSEYFNKNIESGTSTFSGYMESINKLPLFKNYGTSCAYMFSNYAGKELDVSDFDTTNVTSFQRFFNRCENLLNIVGINNLNLSNVTSLEGCFTDCKSIKRLDISNWHPVSTGSGTQYSYMFYNCVSLEFLDIRNLYFSASTSTSQIFRNVPANCEIIVMNETIKRWILKNQRSDFTNIKTVEEYEAE